MGSKKTPFPVTFLGFDCPPLIEWLIKMGSKKTPFPVTFLVFGCPPLIEWLIKKESKKTPFPVTFLVTLWSQFFVALLDWLIDFFRRYLLNTPKSEYESQHSVRLMFGNGLRPEIWTDFVQRWRFKGSYSRALAFSWSVGRGIGFLIIRRNNYFFLS